MPQLRGWQSTRQWSSGGHDTMDATHDLGWRVAWRVGGFTAADAVFAADG